MQGLVEQKNNMTLLETKRNAEEGIMYGPWPLPLCQYPFYQMTILRLHGLSVRPLHTEGTKSSGQAQGSPGQCA